MLCSPAFSLSLCHPDSAPQAKRTTAPSVHNGEGRRPSVPRHALDSVWLECGSSRQYHGMVVEIQSTQMVLLSRRPTTSSGLDESRHASTTSTSRVRVACFLNLGVHVVTATPNSPSKLRRIKRAAAMSNIERRLSASTSIDCPSRVVYCRIRPRPWSIQARSLTVGPYLSRPLPLCC